MNIKAIMATLTISFVAAVASTALTANITDWQVWVNGAMSGISAGIAWAIIYPKMKTFFVEE